MFKSIRDSSDQLVNDGLEYIHDAPAWSSVLGEIEQDEQSALVESSSVFAISGGVLHKRKTQLLSFSCRFTFELCGAVLILPEGTSSICVDSPTIN